MKASVKKFWSATLTLAMILTTVGVDFNQTRAAEDFSEYFVFESYNESETDGYNDIYDTTGQYETEIDGVSYTNYALKSSKGGSATAICGYKECNGIIDGSAKGGYQSPTSKDVQSMIVDMHRTRSISILQLSWETASAKEYAIDFSLDGETWTTVAYLTNCNKTGKRCDRITLKTPQNTRYIRIQGLKRQTSWAYNLYEISAFCASGKADGSQPIAAYTYTDAQKASIDNAAAEVESESESKAQWEAYQAGLAKYVNTDTNIVKGAMVYPSSYYNKEGKPQYMTDGSLSTFATSSKIYEDNTTNFFILDLGKEYTTADIDKVFINYVANEGTWGKDGFKIYASDSVDFTMKTNEDELEVIVEDNTRWNVLYEENNLDNCKLQNYYQDFSSGYEGSFRYLKLEYNYISHERTWGVQINEFALYAPVEEVTTVETTTETPTEPETLRPVTAAVNVNASSTVQKVKYNYKYEEAGYAAGTIKLTTTKDAKYSLYWGTGNGTDGYKALTRNSVPYTALGYVTTTSNQGSFKVISDYTAIPVGATNLLVYNENNDLEYAYEIPTSKRFNNVAPTYTFASIGDQHYNRFMEDDVDLAEYACDSALKFIESQGIKFVAGIGDLSSRSEESAYIKFKESTGDYPNLDILTCIGNHDAEGDGVSYFKKYVNRSIYKYIGEDEAVLEAKGIKNIADNGLDFVYSPEGTEDVFVFLNQNEDGYGMTETIDILHDTQLTWLEEQLEKYADRNVFIYFHTYLSTDSKSTTNCVGNLLNKQGGYSYNLTYDVNAADGERLRSIINRYNNVTMLNGHSHWMYELQIFNPNLNIGTTSGESFGNGATIIHISSVTSPRTIGALDDTRTELHGKASEGTFTDVYSDCNVYTGVDFWNGQYEAYATYIDPKYSAPTEINYNPEETTTEEITTEETTAKETTTKKDTTEKTTTTKSNVVKTSKEYVTIKVATVKKPKAKNIKKKKVKVTWKKISGVTGYNIRYATNKKFKKATVKTVKKNTSKYTIKKLKLKKTYYIQVRAYKVYKGKTYRGKWSKYKKIKIKK